MQQRPGNSLFVGREPEMAALHAALDEAVSGGGRLVLLVGEAGIGKTRTATEFAAQARQAGALVLWGGCYDGEWAPPFGPFAEAVTAYVRRADPDRLREDLAFGAAPIARVIPAVRERLPDVAEPAPLQPDEERFRLLDAVSQFLIATAARAPVMVVLDDLHWADKGSIAMLRHVARFAPQHRLLLLGTYRDAELDPQHPFTDVLGALYRETTCERIQLKGLDAPEVAQLIADSGVPAERRKRVADAINAVTNGNPFFVREVLHHLIEEQQLAGGPADGSQAGVDRLSIPDSVRQVLNRRVRRLGADTGRLLSVAAACGGPFQVGVAAQVAGLDEPAALNAVDDALRAQVLRPADSAERYDFTHALIRHTLYEESNPSRQARLHRQLAAAMERIYGDRATEHAAEIAQQYYRSKALPGADLGVPHAVIAAGRAAAAYARDEEAAFLRIAVELLPEDDPRQPALLARLGLALAWTQDGDAAQKIASEAARRMAIGEGVVAAADYIASVLHPMFELGSFEAAFALARQGLEYAGDRRDATWASIRAIDIIRQDTEDPTTPGLPLDTAERREVTAAAGKRWFWDGKGLFLGGGPHHLWSFFTFASRAELDAAYPAEMRDMRFMNFRLGEYRRGVQVFRAQAAEAQRQGRLAAAVVGWSGAFRFHTALGQFAEAREARAKGVALAARLPAASTATATLIGGEDEWRMAHDEDWDKPMEHLGPGHGQRTVGAWYRASTRAAMARIHARMGRPERALRHLASIIPAIETAPGAAENYTRIACDAAETLWLTRQLEQIESIERNVLEKIVVPDFRYPMADGRLALARLCALQGRYDEAVDWFAKARTVLDEQGAQPLRAIVDYDEGLMYVRRGAVGDGERARPLLESALAQFKTIGMPGWIRRAEHLLREGTEWTPAAPPTVQPPPAPVPGPKEGQESAAAVTVSAAPPNAASSETRGQKRETNLFRSEGDFWTVAYAGDVVRLKHSKGLQYIAHLLRHPGQEFLALDIAANVGGQHADSGIEAQAATREPRSAGPDPVLDGPAKAAYKRRLREVRDELQEAEANNDLGHAERLRAELEMLAQHLRAAVGLGGRDRTAASDLERARSAVGKRIRGAIQRIRAAHPALGRHLTATIATGYFCSYWPDADRQVVWELQEDRRRSDH
jgi:tetratricopeptide (TPR) repeat protein